MQNNDGLDQGVALGDIDAHDLVQHVDLARFLPKKQKVYLSLARILQICGVALVLVVLTVGYGYGERIAISKHLTRLQFQRDALVGKISSERLKKMQEFSGSEMIYAVLKVQHVNNAPGFSAYLTAISQACPYGVWLTAIEIKKRDHFMVVSGQAYHASDIIQMLDNLNREPLFKANPLFLAKIDQVKDTSKDKTAEKKTSAAKVLSYSFTLQTQVIAEPKK